jgi:hypothetical protein
MSKKPKRYHTLAARQPGQLWSPQFGDYDKATVESELNYERDHIGVTWAKGTKFRIVSSMDEQAAIEAAIARLNAN